MFWLLCCWASEPALDCTALSRAETHMRTQRTTEEQGDRWELQLFFGLSALQNTEDSFKARLKDAWQGQQKSLAHNEFDVLNTKILPHFQNFKLWERSVCYRIFSHIDLRFAATDPVDQNFLAAARQDMWEDAHAMRILLYCTDDIDWIAQASEYKTPIELKLLNAVPPMWEEQCLLFRLITACQLHYDYRDPVGQVLYTLCCQKREMKDGRLVFAYESNIDALLCLLNQIHPIERVLEQERRIREGEASPRTPLYTAFEANNRLCDNMHGLRDIQQKAKEIKARLEPALLSVIERIADRTTLWHLLCEKCTAPKGEPLSKAWEQSSSFLFTACEYYGQSLMTPLDCGVAHGTLTLKIVQAIALRTELTPWLLLQMGEVFFYETLQHDLTTEEGEPQMLSLLAQCRWFGSPYAGGATNILERFLTIFSNAFRGSRISDKNIKTTQALLCSLSRAYWVNRTQNIIKPYYVSMLKHMREALITYHESLLTSEQAKSYAQQKNAAKNGDTLHFIEAVTQQLQNPKDQFIPGDLVDDLQYHGAYLSRYAERALCRISYRYGLPPPLLNLLVSHFYSERLMGIVPGSLMRPSHLL